MKLLVNVGRLPGEGLGKLLDRFAAMGLYGIRVDVDHDLRNMTAKAIDEIAASGLTAIFLVAGGKMTKALGMDEHADPWDPPELEEHCAAVGRLLLKHGVQHVVEVGNEPDLACERWKRAPEQLADAFNACYTAIHAEAPHAIVLSPSVSNLNRRGFSYLGRMWKAGIVLGAKCAFHRYPHGVPPKASTPHEGFESRDAELAKLKNVTANRELWCTETGFSTGPYIKRRWGGLKKKRVYLDDEEVAQQTGNDIEWWRSHGLLYWTGYGLNSGPDPNNREDGYGWRHFEEAWDGPWKRVARTIQEKAVAA